MGAKKFFKAFKDAWHGICTAVELGRNIRIELMACAWAMLLVWTSGYGRWYYIAVLLASALVIGAECLNTAVEKLCDRVQPEQEKLIGQIKDMAAGAVLVCAAVALCVALFLFVDLDFWRAVLAAIGDGQGWAAIALVALPAAALMMAFLKPKYADPEPSPADADKPSDGEETAEKPSDEAGKSTEEVAKDGEITAEIAENEGENGDN